MESREQHERKEGLRLLRIKKDGEAQAERNRAHEKHCAKQINRLEGPYRRGRDQSGDAEQQRHREAMSELGSASSGRPQRNWQRSTGGQGTRRNNRAEAQGGDGVKTTTIDRRKVELLRGSTERRSFGAALEVRKSASGTHLRGYASTFGGSYEVSGFRERIVKGAFANTLKKGADVVLLVGHEGIPLARTKSGTLKLSEDARGLRVDAELDPKNPLVQSLLSPLRRGDLTEMSLRVSGRYVTSGTRPAACAGSSRST